MSRWAIDIDRDAIADARIVEEATPTLADGEVEVAIDLIALTANNVTYAALGKPSGLFGNDTGYWDFFADRDAPGRLPVWGFATVTDSRMEGLAPGERLYGYWPLASHAVLRPERVGAHGFVDATPRRAALPPLYNQYQRLSALAEHRDEDHDWWPVYRPLYLTGWLIADQLAETKDAGAAQVVVAAASSKTALGFAQAMRARGDAPPLIALASPASAAFVRETGLYDAVVAYDSVAEIAGLRTAFIDFAGNPGVTRAVHAHFGDALTLSLVVGKAHWDATDGGERPAGIRPTGFFAPARMQARSREWGAEGLRTRVAEAWAGFMPIARALTTIDRRQGADGALAAWGALVAGTADPRAGIVVTP